MQANAQRFSLGNQFSSDKTRFELLGISTQSGVATYRYIKAIDGSMFGRRIGDIVIGVKKGKVVTTAYNLIPLPEDVGVPKSIVNTVQKSLPYPLAYVNGMYGVNIDRESISISRQNSPLTFNKDRIMYYCSIKSSLLSK